MIATLLTMPSTASLYSRVAIHSAPLNYNDQSPQIANSVAQLVLKDLNCTTVTCLSRLPVSEILKTQSKLYDPSNSAMYAFGLIPGVAITEPVRTVVDGTLVKGKFGQLTRGALARTALKPIIFTTVKDEACQTIDSMLAVFITPHYPMRSSDFYIVSNSMTDSSSFVDRSQNPLPEMFFEPVVRNLIDSSRADTILRSQIYDPVKIASSDPDAVRNSLLALGSDYIFTCAAQQSAVNLTVVNSATEVYIARFDMGISFDAGATPFCGGKVGHQ